MLSNNWMNQESPHKLRNNPAAGSKTTTTTKPFFDPTLTYKPPTNRGVVATNGDTPRDRLKELYQHY